MISSNNKRRQWIALAVFSILLISQVVLGVLPQVNTTYLLKDFSKL